MRHPNTFGLLALAVCLSLGACSSSSSSSRSLPATASPTPASPATTTPTPPAPATPPTWDLGQLGRLGFGADTPGGSGGAVITVTTLAAGGPGSLREALEASGPRIVVFEVGGIINLDRAGLSIREPFVTVAGQTAPAPGITIIGAGLGVQTHDVVIRHIRVRPGDAGQSRGSGWEPDGVSVVGSQVWIDHCSFTWAVDENASISGPRNATAAQASHDITLSSCLIGEGLDDSSHASGRHSRGSLVMDGASRIALIGNLYAHNVRRNPYFKGGSSGVVVNNLIYNPVEKAIHLTADGHGQRLGRPRVSAVGNLLVGGRNTGWSWRGLLFGVSLLSGEGEVYADDNLARDASGAALPLLDTQVIAINQRQVWPSGLTPVPVSVVETEIARTVGARPANRDAVDARIVDEVQSGSGQVIDSQGEVGGYPSATSTTRPLSVPTSPAAVAAWLADHAQQVE